MFWSLLQKIVIYIVIFIEYFLFAFFLTEGETFCYNVYLYFCFWAEISQIEST